MKILEYTTSLPSPPSTNALTLPAKTNHIVVSNMDGTLLRAFPFFALVAYEAGGIFRLLFLLLASPLAGLVYHLVSASAGIHVLVFATFVGMKVSDINSVARSVLPKFYSTDLHSETWKVFSSCGKRCVLTANLRIMVEPFLKEFLGADMVLGTEIASFRGRATGFVQNPGILVGNNNADALRKAFGAELEVEAVMSNEKLPKPVIFHDGRLVVKPTPLMALLIVLWIPVGFLLSCIRVAAGSLLPTSVLYYAWWALGVRIYIKGTPPPPATKSTGQTGVIFICSHRTVIDPVVLAAALGRSVSTVTYSVSRLTEIISPIKTVRLTRDRVTDANTIKNLLEHSDVVICPEGTTCREPFLLRFSALFAELSDELVPVAMVDRRSMFHGTTARGWKAMDPYYFFMNPSPAYEVTFLNKLPKELTCGGGNSSFDVANYIQKMIGESLSYECTTFTRKDKYRYLAGNDGMVPVKSAKAKNI